MCVGNVCGRPLALMDRHTNRTCKAAIVRPSPLYQVASRDAIFPEVRRMRTNRFTVLIQQRFHLSSVSSCITQQVSVAAMWFRKYIRFIITIYFILIWNNVIIRVNGFRLKGLEIKFGDPLRNTGHYRVQRWAVLWHWFRILFCSATNVEMNAPCSSVECI